MFKLKAMKRICAVIACTVLTIGAVTQTTTYTKPISAQSESELNASLSENQEKISNLQSQLDGYSKKQKDSEEYQAVLQKKMDTQQENIAILDEEIRRLKNDISDKETSIDNLENKMKVQEQSISEGMNNFKSRLRAVYVMGNDSMASALVGSTSFYDMLSKYDLISQVANYDNNLVKGLKSDLNEYAASKKNIEIQKNDLAEQVTEKDNKRKEMQGALDELSADYQNTEDAKNEAKLQAQVTQDEISEYEQSQNEIESEIASQQAEIQEAESKKAAEAAENNIPSAPGGESDNSSAQVKETDPPATEAQSQAVAPAETQAVAEDDSEGTTTTTTTAVADEENTEIATEAQQTEAPETDAPIVTEAPKTEAETVITQAPKTEYSEETQVATTVKVNVETQTVATEVPTKAQTKAQTKAPATTAAPTTTEAAKQDNNNTSFSWPTSSFTISSGFGYRWGSMHKGIDFAASSGTPITASRSGTVVAVNNTCTHNYPKTSSCGCGGGYGNYVIISHDGTYSTLYGHMSTVNVSVGQTVSQGQQIGTVGCTGFSTGPHCHFEIHVNGTAVDPAKYLY